MSPLLMRISSKTSGGNDVHTTSLKGQKYIRVTLRNTNTWLHNFQTENANVWLIGKCQQVPVGARPRCIH